MGLRSGGLGLLSRRRAAPVDHFDSSALARLAGGKSSKSQTPEKLEISSSGTKRQARLVIGAWDFFDAWCLEFGASPRHLGGVGTTRTTGSGKRNRNSSCK